MTNILLPGYCCHFMQLCLLSQVGLLCCKHLFHLNTSHMQNLAKSRCVHETELSTAKPSIYIYGNKSGLPATETDMFVFN